MAQGHLAEALKSFEDAHAIRARLARSDLANAGWQRDLWASLDRIGAVLVAQGHLDEALTSFRNGQVIVERIAQWDPGNARGQYDRSPRQRGLEARSCSRLREDWPGAGCAGRSGRGAEVVP
jgi:hypothetical protein